MKINETYLKQLQDGNTVLSALMEKHGVPGMSLTVIQGSRPVHMQSAEYGMMRGIRWNGIPSLSVHP